MHQRRGESSVLDDNVANPIQDAQSEVAFVEVDTSEVGHGCLRELCEARIDLVLPETGRTLQTCAPPRRSPFFIGSGWQGK